MATDDNWRNCIWIYCEILSMHLSLHFSPHSSCISVFDNFELHGRRQFENKIELPSLWRFHKTFVVLLTFIWIFAHCVLLGLWVSFHSNVRNRIYMIDLLERLKCLSVVNSIFNLNIRKVFAQINSMSLIGWFFKLNCRFIGVLMLLELWLAEVSISCKVELYVQNFNIYRFFAACQL